MKPKRNFFGVKSRKHDIADKIVPRPQGTMTQPRNWSNRDTRLWLLRVNKPFRFLQCAGLRSVEIAPDKSAVNWICGRCNSDIEGELNCPHCSAPKSGRQRLATIEVYGYLPAMQVLDELRKDFTLGVRHGTHGPPDNYDSGRTVMRFTPCKVTKKWIDDPVITQCADAEIICLNLLIDCRFVFCSLRSQRLDRPTRT